MGKFVTVITHFIQLCSSSNTADLEVASHHQHGFYGCVWGKNDKVLIVFVNLAFKLSLL